MGRVPSGREGPLPEAGAAAGRREPLSAVVVVRDEARQIGGWFRALRCADEVVVVDTGSADGTPEIARGLGCRVFSFEGGPALLGPGFPGRVPFPQPSFQDGRGGSGGSPVPGEGGPVPADPSPPLIHAAKNFGFRQARGPWILNLDADERLTDGLREEILAVLSAPDPEVAAYSLPFVHYFFGRYLRHGGFRGSLIRLFRKGKLRYPEDRAHSTPEVDGRVEGLRNLVVHFNHPRIADFLRKMNLYTSQDAVRMARHGRGGLRNRAAKVPGRLALIREPLSVFWNRFVRHLGFLDGVHGLVACGLLAAYQFVELAKLWEVKSSGSPEPQLAGGKMHSAEVSR